MTVVLGELRTFWTDGRRIERTAYLIGTGLVVVGLGHLVVAAVLGGPWNGPVSWRKPATFGLSFGITLISITWVTSFLRVSDRLRGWLIGAWATASMLEVGLITVQAWRRVPSHFNLETSVDASVARVLAAGAATLVVVLITLFGLSLRPQPQLPSLLRRSIRLGLGTLLLALAIGAAMIAVGMVLVVGGDQQGAYAGGGAFTLAHFVTMHGIAILPGLAWLAQHTAWPQPRREQVVALGTTGYLLVAATAVVAVATANSAPMLFLATWVVAATGTAVLLVAGGLVVAAVTASRISPT